MMDSKRLPTPDEMAEKMRELFKSLDKVVAHVNADALMIEILEVLGYPEAMQIFRDADKWYE